MINVLETDMSVGYKFSWNVAARACYQIFDSLQECMLLYRYKISETYISTKFGCSHPNRIDLSKLDGKNLMLFHIDVYQEDPYKFKDLIDYCQLNNIDMWIPFPNYHKTYHQVMRNILSNYQHNTYDLTGMNYRSEADINIMLKEKLKFIFRDIKLRNLFD